MPKIEPYRPTIATEVPKPSMGLLEPAIEATRRARSNIVEAARTIEGAISGFAEREQKAKDNLEALRLRNEIEKGQEEIADSYSGRTDFENFDKDLNKGFSGLRERVKPKYQSNEINFVYQSLMSKAERDLGKVVKAKKYKVMEEEGKILFNDHYEDAAKDYADAHLSEDVLSGKMTVQEKKDKIRSEVESEGLILQRDNGIDPLWMNSKVKGFEKVAQEGIIVRANNSENPNVIRNTMLALDKGEFQTLDPKETEIYKGHLQNRLEQIDKKAEAEADKISIQNGYNDLKNKFTDTNGITDYNSVSKMLNDTNYQNKMGLRVETKHSLEIALRSEELGIKEINKKQHDDEESKIQTGISLGDPKSLSNIRGAKYITADEKQKWEDVLTKRLKKSDEDINSREDVQNYIRINKMIDLGVDPKVIKDTIATTVDMKTATRYKLIDRVDNELEGAVKQGMKAGNQLLHSQIAPSKGAMMPTIPAEEAASQKAQMALSEWVRTQQKLVVDGKRKPLTQKEIYDQAVDMVSTGGYQIPTVDKLDIIHEEMKKESQKSKKISLENKVVPTPPSPYVIDKIYPDASGRKAKYKGRNNKGQDLWQIQP